MNTKEAERQEAVRELREILYPGDTVFVDLKHVSRSGMSRVIMPFIIQDNEPRYLGWTVAKALDMTYSREKEGIKIGGCGMDMGFALVYDLSRTLFPDGYECIGRDDAAHKYCPSNDHSNGDRDYTPHHHKDGGYALKHRWF